jgi:hypothetical protein
MIQSGVRPFEVQKTLGHILPLMTHRYAYIADVHLGTAPSLPAGGFSDLV